MEINERKSIVCSLKELKYLYNSSDNDFIEITEWTNSEGWDIHIEHNNTTREFSLNYEDLDIINYLTKHLSYNK